MKYLLIFILLTTTVFENIIVAQDISDNNINIVIQLGLLENLSDIQIFLPKLENRLRKYGHDVNLNVPTTEKDISIFIESSHGNNTSQQQNSFVITLDDKNEQLFRLSPVLFSRFSPTFWADLGIIASPEQALDTVSTLVHFTASYAKGDCKNLFEAISELKEKTQNDFTASYISFVVGNCSLIEGELISAIEHFNDSLAYNFDPNFSSSAIAPTTNLAWAYVQQGDTQLAIELMNSLVTELDDFPILQQLALQKRAQIYALIFDYTPAIDDMDTAIDYAKANDSEDETISALYKQRGDIIMLIYEWDRALEDYNIAIELDPDYAEAYYRRGILLYTMVEREDAIGDFETYLELDPGGQFSEMASQYIDSIQTELDALGG